MTPPPVEVDAFGKTLSRHLTHVEASEREATVVKLRSWLAAREAAVGDLGDLEMRKLWKALHYCMWLTDKPPVQEEMADSLAELAGALARPANVSDFFSAFFSIMRTEWIKIDYLRLDKYMLLVRRVLRAWFQSLDRAGWTRESLDAFVERMSHVLLAQQPDGLRMHVAFVYLVELKTATGAHLPMNAALRALEPVHALLADPKTSDTMHKVAMHEVLEPLAQDVFIHPAASMQANEDAANAEGDAPYLDARTMRREADALFALAADTATMTAARRKVLYALATKLRQVADAVGDGAHQGEADGGGGDDDNEDGTGDAATPAPPAPSASASVKKAAAPASGKAAAANGSHAAAPAAATRAAPAPAPAPADKAGQKKKLKTQGAAEARTQPPAAEFEVQGHGSKPNGAAAAVTSGEKLWAAGTRKRGEPVAESPIAKRANHEDDDEEDEEEAAAGKPRVRFGAETANGDDASSEGEGEGGAEPGGADALNSSFVSQSSRSSEKSVRFSHADVVGLKRITRLMKTTPKRPSAQTELPPKGVLKPLSAPIVLAKPKKAPGAKAGAGSASATPRKAAGRRARSTTSS